MSEPNVSNQRPPAASSGAVAPAEPDAEPLKGRYRKLQGLWRVWVIVATIGSLLSAIYIIFGLGPTFGYVPLETQYFYFLLGLLLPLVFLLYPIAPGVGPQHRPAFYDMLIAAVATAISLYFVAQGDPILTEGWEYIAPLHVTLLAAIMWVVVLEAVRRTGGLTIAIICLIVSIYPPLAYKAPGFLRGEQIDWATTANFHMFSTESVIGIPMTAFAQLVIGFLMFGAALQLTGGGAFFLNLSFAVLGKLRGGPAKVAIFSSGLMGSMSGSVITNVLTTGVMTIPAMKRVGFSAPYAGGVEACASTGGVLMPPIMGATAFIMATFLEIPYSDIVVAAILPSLLYYLALFVQIDAYAARFGLQGLPQAELPRLRDVIREGWYFIAVFALLIFLLLYMQREAQAPFWATGALIIINQFSAKHRWNWSHALRFIEGIGTLFVELAGLLAGIGLIIGSLMLTGKVGALSNILVQYAGDSVFLLLLLGALTSFILGIGMTVTAAYLFLAVTLAPALMHAGLDRLAVHLFMMYWGMISFITPPVAIGAFAAATVAGSNGMRTGLEAMRLGAVIYFVPFFFVLNPALIWQGSAEEIIQVTVFAIIGVVLIASGLQGYIAGIGRVSDGKLSLVLRAALVLSGILLALPGGDLVGFSHLQLLGMAAVIGLPALFIAWRVNQRRVALPARA